MKDEEKLEIISDGDWRNTKVKLNGKTVRGLQSLTLKVSVGSVSIIDMEKVVNEDTSISISGYLTAIRKKKIKRNTTKIDISDCPVKKQRKNSKKRCPNKDKF